MSERESSTGIGESGSGSSLIREGSVAEGEGDSPYDIVSLRSGKLLTPTILVKK